MTYRDPSEPVPGDSPTEAYRPTPEAAPAPAPTSPAVTPAPGGRPNRVRWAVAIVAVALIVAASGIAAVLLTGRAPSATVLGWAPAGAVAYGEFRLDLPGDQRANLGEFLAHFPGFDDQAALDTKLDETLDQFLLSATDGDQSYIRDIDPWFDGEVAFVLGELPAGMAAADPAEMEAPDIALLLSVKDAAKAQAWFDEQTATAKPTTEEHGGVTLTLVPSHGEAIDEPVAYAVTGDVAVIGRVDSVKRALDTKGQGGLADDEDFAAALASSDGDHVGFMYLDMATYMAWAMDMAEEAPGGMAGMCGSSLSADMTSLLPPWMATFTRVEGDALVVDAHVPLPAEPPFEQENRVSGVLDNLPATTIAAFEGHDLGVALTASIDQYRDDPACAEAFAQIDSAVGILGGFDNLLGWMGDAAVVVNRTDTGVEGGLVIQPADAEKANNLFLSLRSMVALGGASLGLTITDEAHGDATITTLDLGDLQTLMAMSGSPVTPEELELFGGADAHVQLSYAVTDEVVVFGIGPEFVRHVLDTEAGSSLASDDRFEGLLARAGGASNAGTTFVDVTAMRELLEEVMQLDPDAVARYESGIKPFLLPFDAAVQTSTVDDERADTRGVITVK